MQRGGGAFCPSLSISCCGCGGELCLYRSATGLKGGFSKAFLGRETRSALGARVWPGGEGPGVLSGGCSRGKGSCPPGPSRLPAALQGSLRVCKGSRSALPALGKAHTLRALQGSRSVHPALGKERARSCRRPDISVGISLTEMTIS